MTRHPTLAASLVAIADTKARGVQKNACAAAILLLGIHPTLDAEAPAKDRDAEGRALGGAILELIEHLTADGADEIVRLRPAGDYHVEALRLGLGLEDKLSRLTDPPTPNGQLQPAEWSLLGAATRLHTEEALGPLYLVLSREPPLFSNVRDPRSLFSETCDMEEGVRVRGQHEPVNQWLTAMRDTFGNVHDVLDVATGMVNAQAYFIPAAIFAKKAVLPQTSAACLALQAARVHDICEQAFAKDEKLFRGHLRGAHAFDRGPVAWFGRQRLPDSECLGQAEWTSRPQLRRAAARDPGHGAHRHHVHVHRPGDGGHPQEHAGPGS